MGFYLADVCREIREGSGRNQNYVAGQINSGIDKVKNFELQKIRWSPDTDQLIEVYAELGKVRPVDVWAEAVNRWEATQAEAHPAPAQPERDIEAEASSLRRSSAAGPSAGSRESRQQRRKGGAR